MANKEYTQEQIDALVSANRYILSKSEADKYRIFKNIDPFPTVDAALLNSLDVLKYILTCGIVAPFSPKNLKGITYACTFSGRAYYCPEGDKKMVEATNNDQGFIELRPNSITYLEINETLRVPDYMALRFNLSVSNAYKGLLLGTGPIVDPGFEGQLYIPLHNLTANKYIIKRGAELILIEFTKQSRNSCWERADSSCEYDYASRLDFSGVEVITKKIEKMRTFNFYIKDAMTGNPNFRNIDDSHYVSSSIPEAIKESAKQAESAEKWVRTIKNWGIVGVVGVILTIIIFFWSGYALINDTNTRYDTIIQKVEEYATSNRDLEYRIEELEKELQMKKVSTPDLTKNAPNPAETNDTFPNETYPNETAAIAP